MWVLGNPAQLSSHAEAFLAYTGLSLPQHPKLLLVEISRGLSHITTCACCPKSLRHWSAQFSAFKTRRHLSLCSYGGLLPLLFLKRIGRIHPYMGWINHKSRKRFKFFFFFGVFEGLTICYYRFALYAAVLDVKLDSWFEPALERHQGYILRHASLTLLLRIFCWEQ